MYISEEDPFYFGANDHTYKFNIINENSTIHSNDKSIENGALTFQTSFTDFAQNISKFLYKGSFEETKIPFNPFCPICLKCVGKFDLYTLCNIRNSKLYIIHDKCLQSNPSFQMNLFTQEEDDMFLMKNSLVNSLQLTCKNFDLQYRQFLIEIIFYHPISEKKFGKIQKKLKQKVSSSKLKIDFRNDNAQGEFAPNMLALPMTDYLASISLYEIGEQKKVKITKYTNFKKIICCDQQKVYFGCKETYFTLNVYKTLEQKKNIINELNYKYKYPIQSVNLITIDQLELQLPQQFSQEQSLEQSELFDSSSSKMLEFLEIDKKQDDVHSFTSYKSSVSNISQTKGYSRRKSSPQDLQNSSENLDRQKVNLDKLIKTNTLKAYVSGNTQSRSFQSFLSKASNQQINLIFQTMKNEFVDLMKHQYGNYMMQKLFSVCNLQKRVEILEILIPELNDIVTNKQGTHAFQSFLSLFTTDIEFCFVLDKMRENFYDLCIHVNATHFVQKVVKIFPIRLLNEFFYYCVQNLYLFGCDKNGMCVVKHMMKKLQELTDNLKDKKDLSIQNTETYKFVQEYKKLFAQCTLLNLDAIIGDMYGNYIVQFNYQLFEPIFTSTLTEVILSKLPQYSLSKYSTNVIFKGLNSYWSDQKETISSVLKEVFQPYLILEMYKSKDGNKILLQLMQNFQGYQIWSRLQTILLSIQPSRFYHDRWSVCLGIRSGNIGNWSGFTQAVEKTKRKHKF